MTTNPQGQIEWVGAVSRHHTPLFLSYIISGQPAGLIEREVGLAVGFVNMRRLGYVLQFDKAELTAASDRIRSRWNETGLAFFDDYARRCRASADQLTEDANGILRCWAQSPQAAPDLARSLAEYREAVVRHAAYIETMLLVQGELEEQLNRFIAAQRLASASMLSEELATALKIAIEPTHEILNIRGLLEIGRDVQSSIAESGTWPSRDSVALAVEIGERYPSLWEQLDGYAHEFSWMGRMYYVGEPTSVLATVLRLQNTLRHDCAERLQTSDDARREQLELRGRAVEELGDDSRAQRFADTVSTFMHLRTYRLDAFFISHEIVSSIFEALGRHLSMQHVDDTAFLTWKEAEDSVSGGGDLKNLRSSALRRRNGFSFLCIDGNANWSEASLENKQNVVPISDSAPLRGVTAWPGKARGRVRLVATEADMLSMEHGEVLVSTMTMPALMLAVEKAAAIVTDEGGMLCHAAIVSREFNLPCVIGTGDATVRLSNGDDVIVNADDGVVTTAR